MSKPTVARAALTAALSLPAPKGKHIEATPVNLVKRLCGLHARLMAAQQHNDFLDAAAMGEDIILILDAAIALDRSTSAFSAARQQGVLEGLERGARIAETSVGAKPREHNRLIAAAIRGAS